MNTAIKTDVLIIGAGPTGLSMACQLIRYGIDFIIIDKNKSITPYSKALAVHARTLEIYEQIGLAKKAIEQGTIATSANLLVKGTVKGAIDFTNIGQDFSPYPFVLVLEQSKNEKLLDEFLQSHGKAVLWGHELEGFSQTDKGISAQVKTAEGRQQTIDALYLVGADGPKSLVRHSLGLSFEGSTFARLFYVADGQIDWQLKPNRLYVNLSKETFVLFFPLKGSKRYRIVGVFPEEFAKDEGSILYEEIEQKIKEEVVPLELDIHDIEWFSTYKVHTRRAERFFKGRCFLAGDAAHIHSPAGGQGMNTGIQDAYNLAWKLALVIKTKANKQLFETYNSERLENANRLLKTTDRLFEIAAGSNWFLTFLRLKVLPPIAKHIFSLKPVQRYIFPFLSQIGISYRHSELSQQGRGDFKVKAGDRMPYFLIDNQSIYDKLQQAKFHYLVFAKAENELDFAELKAKIEANYAELVDFIVIPLTRKVTEIFGSERPFSLLSRPDNYLGVISTEISIEVLTRYLKKVL